MSREKNCFQCRICVAQFVTQFLNTKSLYKNQIETLNRNVPLNTEFDF